MKRLITICLCVLFASTVALGDWDEGDDYKMHYPQLPDPYGWDIFASTIYPDLGQKVLADDWLCTETGPVDDIHLWGSWKGDNVGTIQSIHVSIHDNIMASIDPEMPWSHPGELLWSWDFDPTQFAYRDYGSGEQGWLNPITGDEYEYTHPDHYTFHQINIVDIPEPFPQTEGTIYWLDITVTVAQVAEGDQPEWGWKTSLEYWGDDAVWTDLYEPGTEPDWVPLYDPYGSGILDMAFVITPEPATIVLLGLGSLALLRKKRRA